MGLELQVRGVTSAISVNCAAAVIMADGALHPACGCRISLILHTCSLQSEYRHVACPCTIAFINQGGSSGLLERLALSCVRTLVSCFHRIIPGQHTLGQVFLINSLAALKIGLEASTSM